jgi:transposase
MQTNLLRPAPHLSYREVKRRHETADDKRHQRYWNLIRLMSHPKQPLTVKEAAHAAGFSQRWARQLVHRYNEKGPDGYFDQRASNPGNKPLLDEQQKAELKEAIMKGHTSDGNLWTNVTVRDWIAKKTGYRPTSEQTGINYLNNLGFSIKSPRPRHTQAASPEEVAAFKKS